MENSKYLIEQKLKKHAIDNDICVQCLKSREKSCIFYDNNDEHLCEYVVASYIDSLERRIKNV